MVIPMKNKGKIKGLFTLAIHALGGTSMIRIRSITKSDILTHFCFPSHKYWYIPNSQPYSTFVQ